ncbi:SDR family NAD(P)-dependent oxidoreductase [Poseidonocella sedimentorum]|uniref:Short-chain dehydrogenase n=1 Tax=Poseidonocella sedimentorum TaxID=871652 RepID=A0A1I6E989_9RHOB|nr:SDR family NAD(P)-dependent oxidoreductase [Poseidonocella sedimentorum]SFR14068.1 Short-chain dehydrogenase [Poseidonocella sedimentorum]
MKEWRGKRYWIVGASAGLGAALARQLSRVGAELVLSGRNEEPLRTLAKDLPGKASVLVCDVQDDASVEAAVAELGEIDGLVCLAGVYWPMSATEWEPEKVTAMLDVNLTGTARVLGRVVPGMVARGAGHIVLTGSLTAYRGLPGSIGYTASKAGIMSLAECLRADLGSSGVEVQLLNPGFIRTRLTEKNDFRMPFLMEPDEAARIAFEHMNSGRFARAYPMVFSWPFRLGRLLPDGLYFRLFGA